MGQGMDKILPGVYVGNFRDSKDQEQLEKNNITHILAVHDTAKKLHENIEYLCITASDCASQDLKQYFPQTNDFIHKARLGGGNVLIHCLAGVSRSVTVTTAYIMTVTNLDWRDSLNAVRGARRAANPNFGFQRQLQEYQHENLEQAKQKLIAKYGPSPFKDDDEATLRKLEQIHRQWILLGDYSGKVKEDWKTYPLGYQAYKQAKEEKKKAESASSKKEVTYDPTAEGCSVDCQCMLNLHDKEKMEKSTCGILLHRNPRAAKTCLKGSAKAIYGSSVDRPQEKPSHIGRLIPRSRSKSLDKDSRSRSLSPAEVKKETRSNSLKSRSGSPGTKSISPLFKPNSPKGKASPKSKSPKEAKTSPKHGRRSSSPKKSIDYESNLVYKIDTTSLVNSAKSKSPYVCQKSTAKETSNGSDESSDEETCAVPIKFTPMVNRPTNKVCTVHKQSLTDDAAVVLNKQNPETATPNEKGSPTTEESEKAPQMNSNKTGSGEEGELWNINPSSHKGITPAKNFTESGKDLAGTSVDQNEPTNTNAMGPDDVPLGRKPSPSKIPRSNSISPNRLTCRQEVDKMFESKKGKR